jgi:DNA-binding transcriptional regulator YiaG
MKTQTKPQTSKNPGSALSMRLADLRSRLDLSPAQIADYLGVPIHTLRKWESGERNAGAALIRLLDVLNFLEVFAPALHAGLLPGEIGHVKKSGLKRSTDSVMSKNPV